MSKSTCRLVGTNLSCVHKGNSHRDQRTPQMFHQFLGISHYFALLKKYWLFLHQTWQMSRRPIANYIYVKNVSKCQNCDVTVMTSCFLPLLKFLICMLFKNGWLLGSRNAGQRPIWQIAHILPKDTLRWPDSKNHIIRFQRIFIFQKFAKIWKRGQSAVFRVIKWPK